MKFIYQLLIFFFAISVFSSCDETDDNDNTPPTETDFFVEFVIESDTFRYQDALDDYGNGPGVNTYVDGHGRLHSQFTTFSRNVTPPDSLRSALTIQMVKFLLDSLEPSFATDFSLFNSGTYGFGSFNEDSSNVGIDGAVIAYTDAEGNAWSSDRLFGEQSSASNFIISQHLAVDEPLYGGETRGTFNCTVFDGLGNSLELRNGRFFARTILK
jgi:hypothetical protein